MLYVLIFALIWLPLIIFYPTKVIGKKNLPKKSGGVVVCNHLSNLDPVIINVRLVRRIKYLAKVELFKSKSNAWFLNQMGAIPINRGKADLNAIKQGLKVLKDNKLLGVFPEGTRNKTDNLEEMVEVHSGAIMFASRANVPIIPMLIYKKPKFFRRNIIAVGEPFVPQGKNPNKLTDEETKIAVSEMTNRIEALRLMLDKKYKKEKNKTKEK